MIFKERKPNHVTPLPKTLPWLPIMFHTEFRFVMVASDAVGDFTPIYLSHLVAYALPFVYSAPATMSFLPALDLCYVLLFESLCD